MSRHNFEKKKQTLSALLKGQALKRIVRSVQLPLFFLSFCFLALKSIPFFESAFESVSNAISIHNPGYECSFINLESPETIASINEEITKQTDSFSLFTGTERLSKNLLKKIPLIETITCSLDRHNKLHFVITGKGEKALPVDHTTAQPIQELMPMQVPQHHTTLIKNNKKSSKDFLSVFDEMDTFLRSTCAIHTYPQSTPFKDHYIDALAPFSDKKNSSFLQPFQNEVKSELISRQGELV
ncbi:hypothetical protein FJ366_00065 [Candidatus Dependentiae bacterium]|nr:hypothetical protein [Candidatus Dependentiae bacterium]